MDNNHKRQAKQCCLWWLQLHAAGFLMKVAQHPCGSISTLLTSHGLQLVDQRNIHLTGTAPKVRFDFGCLYIVYV